jgi:hypothetical protein
MSNHKNYPLWTVHLPSPNGARPLRCTTDPQGPNGRASSYNDTVSRGGAIYTNFDNGIQTDSEMIWAGYSYRIQSVTYGPASSAYNQLGDIPGCSPEKSSPKVPAPHGSINIIASNTGKPITSDESQVNITVATPTICISIPVYRRSDITKYLQGSDSSYVPIYGSDLTQPQVDVIQMLGGGKGETSSDTVVDLLTNTSLYVYYRDPDAGCVFVPTRAFAIGENVKPPQFNTLRGSTTQSSITRSTITGDKTVLILPNKRGTARVMSAPNKQFKKDKPGTKESTSPTTGIPVIVKDDMGKSVTIVQSPSSEEQHPAHLTTQMMVMVKQVMIFVTILCTIFGIFLGLPMGSVNGDRTPYILSILTIGIAFVFALTLSASSSVMGSSRVVSESSFPFVSTAIFVELCISVLIIGGILVFPNSNITSGDRISMLIYILIFMFSIMILTVGIYTTQTSKSSYSDEYQMYPMYYDRIVSMLKYTLPVTILLMFSSSIQDMGNMLFRTHPSSGGAGLSPILNMVFNPDKLYSNVSSKPIPFGGSDDTLLKSLLWFFDDTKSPRSPVDFSQYPIGNVQSSLTQIPIRGSKYSNTVAAVSNSGKIMAVDIKGRTPRLIETTQVRSPGSLLQKGGSLLKEGYGDGWRIGISFVLMIFFAATLTIPSFTGGIAFKTEERVAEDEREKPTFAQTALDSLYGFGMPIFVFASILYTFWGTGNDIQAGILSTGPIIALIVNGLSFSNRK